METDLEIGDIKFGGEAMPQDPKPKTPRTKSNSTASRTVGRPSRDSKVKEVETELEGFLKLANLGLMARDMHEVYEGNELIGYATCLSVYVETDNKGLPKLSVEGKAFVSAAADIIVDSNFLMKLLDGGDKAGKWIRLAMALQPLVMTVISNHSRRGIEDVRPEASTS